MTRYFAETDTSKKVLRVIVCDDPQWITDNIGGEWTETFMDSEERQYAGIGMFDATGVAPQSFVQAGKPVDEEGEPVDCVVSVLSTTGVGATVVYAANTGWRGDYVPELPNAGQIAANDLYAYDGSVYSVIQPHDRSVYGGDPAQYPALIVRVRDPSVVEPWQQPTTQYNAYRLVNPFTGAPDRAEHNGKTWEVSQGDAAGNNVWEPGAFGWTEVSGGVDEWPHWVQPTGGHDAYAFGAKVTFEGQRYTSLINGNTWSPAAYPQGWQVQV